MDGHSPHGFEGSYGPYLTTDLGIVGRNRSRDRVWRAVDADRQKPDEAVSLVGPRLTVLAVPPMYKRLALRRSGINEREGSRRKMG